MRVAIPILAATFAALPTLPAMASPFGRLFAGDPAPQLGLRDGRLLPCPTRRNCVSSQAADPAQRTAPLCYSGDAAAAMHLLAKRVRANPGASVVTQRNDYLRAEFASAAFGFVDDVEFQLDAATSCIDVRSASRLGYSDFGVNRKRIAALRTAFEAKSPDKNP